MSYLFLSIFHVAGSERGERSHCNSKTRGQGTPGDPNKGKSPGAAPQFHWNINDQLRGRVIIIFECSQCYQSVSFRISSQILMYNACILHFKSLVSHKQNTQHLQNKKKMFVFVRSAVVKYFYIHRTC